MKTGRPSIYKKEDVLEAALATARAAGFKRMTRDAIATRAGCSPGQVSHLLGTMAQLRRAVMRAAVKRRDLTLIAQGLVAGDPYAQAADAPLRRQAMESVL
jgi:AcrR family transcriptional regulator